MTDEEKAECVAAAMRNAKDVSATGTPSQRKMAYRLAIWNMIEERVASEIAGASTGNTPPTNASKIPSSAI